jgi:DNA-binding NarL/FixJ family response regulator
MGDFEMSESSNSHKDKIRIILADDHSLIRQALRMSIEKQPDMEVVGEASDGEEAVTITQQLHPDVIIMDISMPKLNGIDACAKITKENTTVAILVLTIHSDSSTVQKVLNAGARGYVNKTASATQIIGAIRTVFHGEAVLPLISAREIAQSKFSEAELTSQNIQQKISPRELEILKLLAKGLPNKTIAQRLNLQETSIKSYLTSLFIKLGVGTRSEAVAKGLQIGYVNVDDFKQDG